MDPVFIAVIVPLGVFAMIYGLRYFENKERMAMIEKGMDPGVRKKRPGRPTNTLKGGLIFIGVGIGLLLAYLLDSYMLRDIGNNVAIYFGLIGLGGGTGLVISYFFEKRDDTEKDRNI